MRAEHVTTRYLTTTLESYPNYKTALSIGAALVGVSQAVTWSQNSVMQAHLTSRMDTLKAEMSFHMSELKLEQADLRKGLDRVELDTAAIRKDLAALLHRDSSLPCR